MKKYVIDPERFDTSMAKKVARTIREGGIVALPTETVYGLACRADRPEVVEKLYVLKQRPKEKPLSYVVDTPQKAADYYFKTMLPFGYRLMEKFWPGPLTIIFYSTQDKKIGVRIPSYEFTQEVVGEVAAPVFFPSANISGQEAATTALAVEQVFNGKIDFIVDGGKTLYGRSSTVVDLTAHPFQIVREGVVSAEEITGVFTKKRILFVCTGNTCRSPIAEFLLKKYLVQEKPYLAQRYEIISCGISPFTGNPPASNVVSLLQEREKLDVRSSTSKRLERELLLSSDLIFPMEEGHYTHIVRMEPSVKERVLPLKRFLPKNLEKDIPDPIGKKYEVNEEVYELIKKAVMELVKWLQ